MLPRNNLEKRSFALAKESGRNAARFFINKYPELFYRDDAEPKVEAFTFKEVYTPDMTFNLKDLEVAIARREVTNSMIAFNKLREQGIEIERNVFLDFFELVAFFNERDVFDADMTEEMWFQREEQGKKTWKDGGLIDQLYGEHESTYPQLTGIYLQALVKHYHMNKAFELYGHAIQSGKPLSLDAYNAVLQTIPYVRQSGQSRYELLIELLKQIAQRKLKPDLQTFNGALAVISRNSRWKGAKNEAQKVLNEMKALSITPTLGTYYYILRIFYHEANDMNDTLPRIIDAIKDKTFVYTCPEDR